MHPYSNLSAPHFWRRSVPGLPWRELRLAGAPKFQIAPSDRISTAGSCFAQHISRYLRQAGVPTLQAEEPHPLLYQLNVDTASYELFPARYGNIYTARQCLEMLRQATNQMPIIHDYVEQDGRWYDLLRPNAVPNGFATLAEAQHDRIYHLVCVNHMFSTSDVFVLTLGLTECWYHAESGHTYPVCPGTARGQYNPEVHKFRNLTHAEVTADLEQLIAALKELNPSLKLILTVSPVPLVATYTDQHVLVASSYSKSVLRAAAGEIEARHAHVAYFPSYEIISHVASFGQYLASDLRDVADRGVHHVMTSFLDSYLGNHAADAASSADGLPSAAPRPKPAYIEAPVANTAVECEEIFNEAPGMAR
ncbi:GSCFA domain-containing protein [Duganella sp. BuS-21]|uniref:GSCFA domain-containing protein n=1 Tax=Duganella sp. BuS-21 TaxID=2943848 RepID=UPI0035A6D7CB